MGSFEAEGRLGVGTGSDPDAETIARLPAEEDGDEDEAREDSPLDGAFAVRLRGEADPEQVGRYRIVRRLGAGGMSLVYVAHDDELDREVAIKLLQGGFAEVPGWRRRLRREALAMAKLSHVNIAHVYEVGEHEGRPFLAMELVRGPTLGQWMRERDRSVPEIIAMYIQAGRGLAAAHDAGLVHRDFKPDNVLVDKAGWARVLDFGLVTTPGERRAASGESRPPRFESPRGVPLSDDLSNESTRPGTVVGTPTYMPPEQMRGEEIDTRADQFSFCVALFEALHGHKPFRGRSMAELAAAIESGSLRSDEGPRVPTAIDDVLERGLAATPADRWPTMNALIDALTLAMQQRERTALEQEAADRDFRRNRELRIKLLILDGSVLGGAAAILTIARLAGWHRAGYLDAIVVLGVFWLANFLYHRRLAIDVNTINRRWHIMTMVLPPLWAVHFGLCAWADLDFTVALAFATILCAGVLIGANMMVNNANPVLPIGLLLTGVAILAYPPLRGLSLLLGIVGTFVASRWVLRRRAALQAAEP